MQRAVLAQASRSTPLHLGHAEAAVVRARSALAIAVVQVETVSVAAAFR